MIQVGEVVDVLPSTCSPFVLNQMVQADIPHWDEPFSQSNGGLLPFFPSLVEIDTADPVKGGNSIWRLTELVYPADNRQVV